MIKMLTNRLVLIIFTTCLIMTLPACKKSTDDVKSKTVYLTQGNWKEIKYETKTDNGPWVDQTGTPLACVADNYIKFLTSGTYEANEGLVKCNPGDPQILDAGTWSFLTNETQLSTTSTGSTPDIVDINQLDDNTLIVTYSYVFGTSTYYDRTTFSH